MGVHYGEILHKCVGISQAEGEEILYTVQRYKLNVRLYLTTPIPELAQLCYIV